ncbi:unnamed protein product [Porites evermanni]|uniref:Uncharacterized protein n=1 Tax=Porites evermanni TaxID=104178 RepID=A0ABN8M392_9CNID|nr:unnamed protein product [Porites evermanni]
MKEIFAQLYNKTWRGADVRTPLTPSYYPLYNCTEEQRAIRLKTYFVHENELYSKISFCPYFKFLWPRYYISNGENVVTFLEFIKHYSHYRMRDHHWRQYEKICHPCLLIMTSLVSWRLCQRTIHLY